MNSKNNSWMSFSDLMTGLMVIFMFIAISYIVEVQKAEAQRQKVVTDFQDTRNKIHQNLEIAFEQKKLQWNMEIGKDLSIRFNNPNVMFNPGKADIMPDFKKILDEFLPIYLRILTQDSLKTYIKEIRIEGHTDATPFIGKYSDPYMSNVALSQERSANVLNYLRNIPYYKKLDRKTERRLRYWITANGLSYGKTLDNSGKETYISGGKINNDRSRRVEFRIITTSEELIEQIVKGINKDE